MIKYTSPFLPPYEEYEAYLKKIWKSEWLTNNGPLLNELELKLKEYLDLRHFLFMTNGTITIQIAIKALELKGEIITTPFSYVATTSSIVWENCTPVFVDIDKHTYNIDADKIEAAITENTSAILATHVYGIPCEVEKINAIAIKHNLKIIYDAAHCFGVNYKNKSILEYGDVSTISFHATKLFHTTEGGGVATTDPVLLKRMAFMRKFGHDGPENFAEVGINGKNSEFHAAMGLANLKYIDEVMKRRKEQYLHYQERLEKLDVSFQQINDDVEYNYAYLPILFKSEEALLASLDALNAHRIFPRRYFYPLLSGLPYVENKRELPVAESIANKVLCLPLFHDLEKETIDMICRILMRVQSYG